MGINPYIGGSWRGEVRPWVYNTGSASWRQAKKIWVMVVTETGEPPTTVYTWHLVKDWSTPTTTPGSARTLEGPTFIPGTGERYRMKVTWTRRTDPTSVEYPYTLVISYEKKVSGSYTVIQSNSFPVNGTTISHTSNYDYVAGDDVRVRVYFQNAANVGPDELTEWLNI